MSHQIFARKYRPASFDAMIGQSATLTALKNALKQKKIHHTYLFSGQKGVGKTSLGRLFAKCLNCSVGITSVPCNTCKSCQAFNQNNFIDFIEVDAASRTQLEDTQELIDSLKYKPSLGRYKVYLIDEVHMLSRHSFNALLKPLEEPPPHVIFLLATTDPERLPPTILSRCFHFVLKNLSLEEIVQQLKTILHLEKIRYEDNALKLIAQASEGSVRDALNLLEQGVLLGNFENVRTQDVIQFLGIIDASLKIELVEAVCLKQTEKLLTIFTQFEENTLNYDKVLEDLINVFCEMSKLKCMPSMDSELPEALQKLTQTVTEENIQLFYQIALKGKQDLPLAFSPRSGFEMTLLRMLAFQPLPAVKTPLVLKDSSVLENKKLEEPKTVSSVIEKSKEIDWMHTLTQLPLEGFLKSLALNCCITRFELPNVDLQLDPRQKVLYSEERKNALETILNQHFKCTVHLTISIGDHEILTPAIVMAKNFMEKKEDIKQSLVKDPHIKTIVEEFGATINFDSLNINDGINYE